MNDDKNIFLQVSIYTMETHIQATEDALIDTLSFKLPATANFINDRRSVSFFPSGSNEYGPRGVKIMKFMLTGTDWLDPSTLRVQFRLNNKDTTKNLHPLNPLPATFFRRLRILCGGIVVEDIDFYNRVYNMVHTLLPTERRMNDYAEGFGLCQSFGSNYNGRLQHSGIGFDAGNESPTVQDNRIVLFPLLCGIFNQPKMLPLRFLQGLQIELEVVNNFTDPILSSSEYSTTWSISEPQVKCDVVTLDNQLDNEYTDHLMQGKSLPINFSSFVHQVQAIGQTDRLVISLSRAFTRLKTVYVTFYKQPKVWALDGAGKYGELDIELPGYPLKECNFFFHPQWIWQPDLFLNDQNPLPDWAEKGGFVFQHNTEVEAQIQIGSKLIPELPIRSSAEAYYHLRKSLGCHQPGSGYGVNILDREFRTSKFILAFDCERQTNAGFSGLNTRTGDLITIKMLNFKHIDNAGVTWDKSYPDFQHTTLEYDSIMTITDAGVQVLE